MGIGGHGFHRAGFSRAAVQQRRLYERQTERAGLSKAHPTEVLEDAARGTLTITSLAEESRPPASTGRDQH